MISRAKKADLLVKNGLGEWPFLVLWFDLDLDLLGEWGQQLGAARAEAQVGDARLEDLVDDGLEKGTGGYSKSGSLRFLHLYKIKYEISFTNMVKNIPRDRD